MSHPEAPLYSNGGACVRSLPHPWLALDFRQLKHDGLCGSLLVVAQEPFPVGSTFRLGEARQAPELCTEAHTCAHTLMLPHLLPWRPALPLQLFRNSGRLSLASRKNIFFCSQKRDCNFHFANASPRLR